MTHREVDVQFHSVSILALDGRGEWVDPRASLDALSKKKISPTVVYTNSFPNMPVIST